MRTHHATTRRIAGALSLCSLAGCPLAPITPTPSADQARVDVEVLGDTSELPTLIGRISLSPDGQTVAFAAGEPSNIFLGPVGGPFRQITDAQPGDLLAGGTSPGFLDDGRVFFARPDPANPNAFQIVGGPADAVTAETFAEFDFGAFDFGPGLSLPESVTLSGDASRGVLSFGEAGSAAFEFEPGAISPTVTGLSDAFGQPAFSPVISRTGDRIAFTDSAGRITLQDFTTGARGLLGAGAFPSFTRTGQVGFVDTAGTSFIMSDPFTGTFSRFPFDDTVLVDSAFVSTPITVLPTGDGFAFVGQDELGASQFRLGRLVGDNRNAIGTLFPDDPTVQDGVLDDQIFGDPVIFAGPDNDPFTPDVGFFD